MRGPRSVFVVSDAPPSNAGQRWSRDQLVLAFNLYCKTPFGRIHTANPDIVRLAGALGQSAAAVSLKLANLARLDPALQARGIRGMTHGSRAEADIWDDFEADGEALAFESERLLAERIGIDIESTIDLSDVPQLAGREREAIVRTRVGQSYFRSMVLARYENTCCITGLRVRELLVASHIIPWAREPKQRMNPRNGLCLNALHDRAFDRGLLTVTPDLRVAVASSVRSDSAESTVELLSRFDGRPLMLPDGFAPDPAFLDRHRETVFVG